MPESDDHNSSLNRREPESSDFEVEDAWRSELEESGAEPPYEADWDSSRLDDDEIEDFDLSFKFEDYAPVWVQKIKVLFSTDPEWSLASAVGVLAILLTVILLLGVPDGKQERLTAEIVVPEQAVVSSVPLFNPIDTRIEIEPSGPYPLVELGTEPLYVSFGDRDPFFPGIVTREEKPMRPELPLSFPEFNPTPEPASAPSLVLNVQKIRIIEREMFDPDIDQQFFVEATRTLPEMHSRLEAADRFLFDQSWKLIDLARADSQMQQTIRPTLYHERFPGGEHVQVGQEQPADRSQLDSFTRASAPPQEERLNLEIRKQVPPTGAAQNLLTYSILVKNRGTLPAYNVHVDETLSPLASLVDFSPPAEVKQNHLHWKIARLDPEEERELQVKIFLGQEGSVKTNSNITLASNVAASTEISAARLDLQINGPEMVTAGEIYAIDFVVSNQGAVEQNDVLLNLDLPEGLEHQAGRQLTFKMNQLAANESRTLRARVKATKSGSFTSQAALMADGTALDEAELRQNVVERKTEPAATPAQQRAPLSTAKPAPAAAPAAAVAPVQVCPCQPVYGPIFYLVP